MAVTYGEKSFMEQTPGRWQLEQVSQVSVRGFFRFDFRILFRQLLKHFIIWGKILLEPKRLIVPQDSGIDRLKSKQFNLIRSYYD